MQRIKLPPIRGHYLTLTLKEAILTLEVEEESSGKISFLNLHEDSVYEETNGFFETLSDLFEGLKSATKGSYPEITLRLSKEELAYIGTYSLGSKKVEHSFNLKLTEKRIEAELRELQNKSEKMAQRLKEFEELHENLKASILSKPDFYFNPDSVFASSFKLTDKNKTVRFINNTAANLEILPQIPSRGLYCFSFKINNTKNDFIYFGIFNEKEVGFSENSLYYGYWMHNGRIHGKTIQQPTGKRPYGGIGAIIKMVIDMDQRTFTFFVDNRQVNSCQIAKSEKYIAFVNLGDIEDSITLL